MVDQGTLRKVGGQALSVGVAFESPGQLAVLGGMLQLDSAAAIDGAATVDRDATLEFGAYSGWYEGENGTGAHTLGAAGSVSGLGRVVVSGGTLTAAGTLAVAAVRVQGGELALPHALTLPRLELVYGKVSGDSAVTVTDTFQWDGGEFLDTANPKSLRQGRTLRVGGRPAARRRGRGGSSRSARPGPASCRPTRDSSPTRWR